jgi:hypothetical protein
VVASATANSAGFTARRHGTELAGQPSVPVVCHPLSAIHASPGASPRASATRASATRASATRAIGSNRQANRRARA